MYFDQHDILRAREHHERLLTEARILRLIRATQRPVSQEQRPRRLLDRVFSRLRERAAVRA
ncbi:MAG: hypothetical protein RLZZ387_52 [Chloroflexota bacterium]|jgi:hypothetical protein